MPLSHSQLFKSVQHGGKFTEAARISVPFPALLLPRIGLPVMPISHLPVMPVMPISHSQLFKSLQHGGKFTEAAQLSVPFPSLLLPRIRLPARPPFTVANCSDIGRISKGVASRTIWFNCMARIFRARGVMWITYKGTSHPSIIKPWGTPPLLPGAFSISVLPFCLKWLD